MSLVQTLATPFALRYAGHLRSAVLGLWLLAALGAGLGWWRLMPSWFGLVVLSVLMLVLVNVWARWQRGYVIREAPLPQFLKRKLRETYPALSWKDADLVERGLRQYFLACARSPREFVAMPSKAVDALWHEFILHTKAYKAWCDMALGRFLHHTPAEALGTRTQHNDGLRRAWYWACKDEAIDPRQPTRLPLLFALDAKLQIPGGFTYQPDCADIRRKNAQGGDGGVSYCGTDFSDGSFSGDADGFGGADASGGDGGDGGGCGGD